MLYGAIDRFISLELEGDIIFFGRCIILYQGISFDVCGDVCGVMGSVVGVVGGSQSGASFIDF